MTNYIFRSKKDLITKDFLRLAKYFDNALEYSPHKSKHQNKVVKQIMDLNELDKLNSQVNILLLDGTINHSNDILKLLQNIKAKLNRSCRVQAVLYSPYLKWVYKILTFIKIRKESEPVTFLTQSDLNDLCKLAEFDIVSCDNKIFFPFDTFFIFSILNRLISTIPLLNRLALVQTITLRPIIKSNKKAGLSVIIPARNESGNIKKALNELSKTQIDILEIIFIEGNSSDDTWQTIKTISDEYKNKMQIVTLQQSGKGKNDAVRLGFKYATQELLTILDADLTVEPSKLDIFYNAYINGYGDFINGSRLLYPMEKEAMRFLNLLGNVFFAKALSFVLNTKLTDSLCGTKLFSRTDYIRILKWRDNFGDFDPFGDFELLFPAADLKLGIINIPISYRARTYGSTNIRRFRDGLILLRMTLLGFFKITLRP